MNSRRQRFVILISASAILLSGCVQRHTPTVVLWAHRVDVAAIVELYNAEQREFKIEMRHVPDPATAIAEGSDPPDVIISDAVANQELGSYFAPLGSLVDRAPVADTVFYRDLLRGGHIDGRQRLLPLSFDLPAVIFQRHSRNEDLAEFSLHVDDIRSGATEFNTLNDERFTRMGLSPRWNTEFLYTLAAAHGARFHENSRNADWDEQRLRGSIDYVRDWVGSDNQGVDRENEFTNRYLYDPKYQLLMRERIRFAYVRASELFQYTDSQRQRIDYRWISGDQGIPVLENVVYVGTPQDAPNRRGAQDVLEWLFQPQTHARILESVRSKRLPEFGIAGGFSAIPAVNERHFPRYYPALLGLVPREDKLVFPPRVPRYWNEIRSQVVEPWLYREASSLAQPRPLREEIRLWLLQRG
ncbi:MAG: hypothetical protein EA404_12395 [Spirochaetaceae bacterium]|nr:MAG: hypothetical protein EA404_12395 [Spirochaetaceae bacterium]